MALNRNEAAAILGISAVSIDRLVKSKLAPPPRAASISDTPNPLAPHSFRTSGTVHLNRSPGMPIIILYLIGKG